MRLPHVLRLLPLALLAAGKDAAAADPPLAPFSKIRSEGTADLDVTVGKPQATSIACSDGGPTSRVTLSVSGNELVVKTKPNDSTRCTVTITVDALTEIGALGTGSFSVHGKAALARIVASGTGPVRADAIDVGSLEVKAEGTGSLTFAGKATSATIVLAGTGGLAAKDLATESMKLKLMGTGSATVTATKKADITLQGLGSATVHGNPAEKVQKKEGLGKITFAT